MSPAAVAGLTGAKVVVFGMARSGQRAAELAVAAGAAAVVCTDLRPDAPEVPGTRAVYGHHDDADLLAADVIILSPGIPPHIAPLQRAREAGVEVRSELDVATSVLAQHGIPVLAVTGTNGKSSTVWLLHQVLLQAGRKSWVGGNLGDPVSSLALAVVQGEAMADVAVVEVSSYQLETTTRFRPSGAAVLNLTPDHLARHKTMAAYAQAKLRLFVNQQEGDLAVLPPRDLHLKEADVPGNATRLWLGALPGVTVHEDHLQLDDTTVDLTAFPLPGHHNRTNLAAALLLARHVGVSFADLDLSALRPLPHRMEAVHVDDRGVTWINDSKATNVDAALVGASAAPDGTVFLLGGDGKEGADYTTLIQPLRPRARRVICFGRSGPDIAAQLQSVGLDVDCVASLPGAVSRARAVALPGDTILLSPACASFDAYSDFEARGRHFADLARSPAPSPPTESAP
jgi:UDP-N-acetylmuramoylalanine--D-glutamate ligase